MKSKLRLVLAAHATARAVAVALFLALAACDDADKTPPIAVAGGSFIFNYRDAAATYGITLKLARAMPKGTVIEAEFENPAGGAPVRVRETVVDARRGYALETPPLSGVVADRDYLVVVRLRETVSEREIYRLEHRIRSGLDQSVLPDKPLTVGPGYTPNPEAGVSRP